MNYEIFDIPCCNLEEGVGVGRYLLAPELEGRTSDILDRLLTMEEVEIDLPMPARTVLCGRRIGSGLELTLKFQRSGSATFGAPPVSVFLAVDEAASEPVRRAALKRAEEFGYTDDMMHPRWRAAMDRPGMAPFTILMLNRGEQASKDYSPEELQSIQLVTGFTQGIIATALKRAGYNGNPISEAEMMAELPEPPRQPYVNDSPDKGRELAGAVQTGGEPYNVLIVAPGTDEYPQVYAHIMDLELDVFRVHFSSDGTMVVNPDDLGYLTLDGELLTLIQKLSKAAAKVWAEADRVIEEHYEKVGEADASDLPDPIAHLYTQHEILPEVPTWLAEKLKSELGVRVKNPGQGQR
jgi:hypothetical protein